MDKKLIELSVLNCDRGAQMGRSDALPSMRLSSFPLTWGLAVVPLFDGYDAGGAYWGIGDPLYVAEAGPDYSEELGIDVYVRVYFRDKNWLAATVQLGRVYPSTVAIVPTHTNTWHLLARVDSAELIEMGDGWGWKMRHEAIQSSHGFETPQAAYESLMQYLEGEEP